MEHETKLWLAVSGTFEWNFWWNPNWKKGSGNKSKAFGMFYTL